MTTFQAVNTSLASVDHAMDHNEETTPTTPRPNMTSIPIPRSEEQPSIGNTSAESSQSQNAAGIAGQRPLPTSPFPSQSSVDSGPGALSRGSSLRSTQEGSEENMDIDDDSDEEEDDSQDGGDDGTDGGDSRLSKKKKPQRFFCTDFPPCTLSFTRSEHLARHIRKHTGERPFQCHCARRFSRLDNLRQHAQTVHVNEEIPGDSLAATGTRFQRQIRTDRVRPPGRARAGTGGSQGSHSRGHSRNLSTSSIGSTASNFSQSTEPRRRPPPLIMANDPNARARLNIDTMTSPPSTPPNQYRGFSNHSPGDLSTPTSATFSTGPASPGYGSSIGSPISAASRNSMVWGSRTPGRRLSVPSGQNPFQSPHGNTYPPPYFSPLAPSNASYSNNSSVFASPTASSYSFARNDPNAAADADWRRRTWHPSTYSNYVRPATSGLSYYQTPDEPQPAFASHATAAAGQTPRLPGIESFDHVQHRPSTPPRRGPSPMQVDSASQQPTQPVNANPRGQPSSGPGHHRSHVSWDMSLHSNLTRLDITTGTPPKDAAQWSQQTLGEIQNAASRPYGPSQSESRQVVVHQDRPQSYEQEPTTPRKNKRHGWYNGPFQGTPQTSQALRTSPEDSSSSDGVPTPGISAAEFHPAIMHSNGYIESHHPSMAPEVPQNICAPQAPHPSGYRLAPDPRSHAPMQTMPPIQNNDMGRLEALVAVATSEENAATKTF